MWLSYVVGSRTLIRLLNDCSLSKIWAQPRKRPQVRNAQLFLNFWPADAQEHNKWLCYTTNFRVICYAALDKQSNHFLYFTSFNLNMSLSSCCPQFIDITNNFFWHITSFLDSFLFMFSVCWIVVHSLPLKSSVTLHFSSLFVCCNFRLLVSVSFEYFSSLSTLFIYANAQALAAFSFLTSLFSELFHTWLLIWGWFLFIHLILLSPSRLITAPFEYDEFFKDNLVKKKCLLTSPTVHSNRNFFLTQFPAFFLMTPLPHNSDQKNPTNDP